MAPVQFTCEHCHRPVPWMDAGLRRYEHRNQCPWCLHSKHILFGTATLPPCDAPMRPVTDPGLIKGLLVQECDGCGFRWVTYDEDWWATLTPAQQTETINIACAETERQNGSPLAIYIAEPGYSTRPPRIPRAQIPGRPRVTRRP